jgi:hypothetical protein
MYSANVVITLRILYILFISFPRFSVDSRGWKKEKLFFLSHSSKVLSLLLLSRQYRFMIVIYIQLKQFCCELLSACATEKWFSLWCFEKFENFLSFSRKVFHFQIFPSFHNFGHVVLLRLALECRSIKFMREIKIYTPIFNVFSARYWGPWTR